mgnify:CR=1 FL=1|jgi:hypothetical protein
MEDQEEKLIKKRTYQLVIGGFLFFMGIRSMYLNFDMFTTIVFGVLGVSVLLNIKEYE